MVSGVNGWMITVPLNHVGSVILVKVVILLMGHGLMWEEILEECCEILHILKDTLLIILRNRAPVDNLPEADYQSDYHQDNPDD